MNFEPVSEPIYDGDLAEAFAIFEQVEEHVLDFGVLLEVYSS